MSNFAFLILILSFNAWAGLFIQNTTNYSTDEDSSSSKLSYSGLKNTTLIGAEFLKNKTGIVGQNIHHWSREYKTSSNSQTESISMLELGPRVQLFFDEPKTFYLSLAFNIYAKGDRQIAGVNEEVRGTSYQAGIGYQLKINRSFFWGVSLNYHSLTLSEKVVNNTETKISDSYSSIYPAFEFSLRFR